MAEKVGIQCVMTEKVGIQCVMAGKVGMQCVMAGKVEDAVCHGRKGMPVDAIVS